MLQDYPETQTRDARDIVSMLWYRADGSRIFGSRSAAPTVIVTTARDWFAIGDTSVALPGAAG